MSLRPASLSRQVRCFLRAQLMGPQILAFLPALTLAAYWVGGQAALMMMALIVPGLFAFGGLFGRGKLAGPDLDAVTKLPHRTAVVQALDAALPLASSRGHAASAMAVAIDNFQNAVADLDSADHETVLAVVADRIKAELRENDIVARAEGARFAIGLTSIRRADHALMIDIATRLQNSVKEPISVSGQRVHLTLSVGFCLPGKVAQATGDSILEAAEAALAAARSQSGGGVRSFDKQMPKAAIGLDEGAIADVSRALDNGEIQPWFQPQVSATTSEVVGFEALARWVHPERGTILPADFLPLLEPAGQSRRLGEVMLYGSFSLLKSLEKKGLTIPRVSVNMSHAELASPDLADRLKWELDRFDLAPSRLAVEVLETAIARDTTAVERNLRALSSLGCAIDLDDFGTGNTSIAGIKRFAITRLKIDRSFVTRIDTDREQKDMVRAIQTMGQQLGLETIAEGVETVAEQVALAELGCDMIQGFVLARPMPADDVERWVETHRRKIDGNHTRPAEAVRKPQRIHGKTA